MIGVLWIACVLALIWAPEENCMAIATSILRFLTGGGDGDANGVAAEDVPVETGVWV
jgi:hypothetical protein